jgi:hypothetical protein
MIVQSSALPAVTIPTELRHVFVPFYCTEILILSSWMLHRFRKISFAGDYFESGNLSGLTCVFI